MFQPRTISTLIILFIIYLGVVYTAHQRKMRPKCVQPTATTSHQTPVTNRGSLLTAEPAPSPTNIHNRLN